MHTSEKIIRAGVIGQLTEDELDQALDIALRVEISITCPITGNVLDTRTARAWVIDLNSGDKTTLVLDPSVTKIHMLNVLGGKGNIVETFTLSEKALAVLNGPKRKAWEGMK